MTGPSIFRRALPGVRHTMAGAAIWAITAAVSAVVALVFWRGWLNGDQIRAMAIIFAAGAALAFPPALYLTNIFAPKRSYLRLFVIIVLLAAATMAMTAGIFALVYRDYYSQWHGPAFSRLWMWQQAFTIAGAVFQYLVVGLRLYIPVGLIGLIAISLWVNRLAR